MAIRQYKLEEFLALFNREAYEELQGVKEEDIDYNRKDAMLRNSIAIKINKIHKLLNKKEDFKHESDDDNINEIENHNIKKNVYVNMDANIDISIKDLIDIAKTKQLPKPQTFRDTHTPCTFWVENDVIKVINSLCVNKGDKSKFVNNAFKLYLKTILLDENE